MTSALISLVVMVAGVSLFAFTLYKFLDDEKPKLAIAFDFVVYFSKIPLAFLSIFGGAYVMLSTHDFDKFAIFLCIGLAIDLSVMMLVQKRIEIGIAFLFALKWLATAFCALVLFAAGSLGGFLWLFGSLAG